MHTHKLKMHNLQKNMTSCTFGKNKRKILNKNKTV